MRGFRKFLLWVLMVLLFTVLVVGGVLLYFYYQVQPEESIQKTLTVETLPAEGTEGEAHFLKPDGYTLEVPVLGGVLTRAFSADTLGEQQTLEWDQVQAASLTAPEGGQIKKIVVTRADEIIFSDGSEAYAELKYPGSGSYEYEVQVELPAAAEGERMRESGSLTYRFTVAVSLQASAWLSDDRVSQGSIVALHIENNIDGHTPEASTELGPVHFLPAGETGWVAYLPVSYNREAGDYTVEVRCGDYTASLPLTVEYKSYEKKEFASAAELPDTGIETASSANAYRNAIWPLYETAGGEQLWEGRFERPVSGRIKYEYGMGSLLPGDTVSSRHSGIDYIVDTDGTQISAPAAGEVVFAGYLELTGNTLVIEHGGGLKSYFYFVTELGASAGETVEKGQKIGTQNIVDTLHYEIKIGNQSIDPGPVFDGTSGLYR